MDYSTNTCQTHQFLDLLFGSVPSGFVEVTYLVPDGIQLYPRTVVQWREMPLGTIDPELPTVHAMNQNGYSCYFAPAVRNRLYEQEQRISKKTGKPFWMYPRGKALDACWITSLWVDIDDATQDDYKALCGAKIMPQIVITSGGGLHGYWLLSEPLAITDDNRAEIVQTLKGLAISLRGDSKVADLARVMRLPGTINTKPSRNGAICEVLDIIPGGYHYMDLMLTYAPYTAPKLPPPTRQMNIPADKRIPGWVENYLNNGARQGERNERLYAAMRSLLDNGFAFYEAEAMCKSRALADGLDDEEINRTISSAAAAPRGTANVDRHMSVRMGTADKRSKDIRF